jgi:hypothetical protein
MCFARFNGCAVSRCAVSMASPFLGLAYAELKVNFVEGFAVLCASHVSMASPFLAALFLAALFLASLFLWLRRFWVSMCFARFNGFAV